jgi:hypothetical protein
MIVLYECNRVNHHPPAVLGKVEWTIEWANPAPGIDLPVYCPICQQMCNAKHFNLPNEPDIKESQRIEIVITLENATNDKWKARVDPT